MIENKTRMILLIIIVDILISLFIIQDLIANMTPVYYDLPYHDIIAILPLIFLLSFISEWFLIEILLFRKVDRHLHLLFYVFIINLFTFPITQINSIYATKFPSLFLIFLSLAEILPIFAEYLFFQKVFNEGIAIKRTISWKKTLSLTLLANIFSLSIGIYLFTSTNFFQYLLLIF